MRSIVIAAFATLILCVFYSCKDDNLKVPKSDATPPIGKWIVTDSGDGKNIVTREFTQANNEWDISPHHKIHVVFSVEDTDGGVQKVALSGGGLTACSMSMQDDIASVSIPPDTTILKPASGNVVLPKAVKEASINLMCKKKEGTNFPQVARGPGGTIEIFGYGENYHQGKVTSKLTIKTTP
jgi:hypothetical protein